MAGCATSASPTRAAPRQISENTPSGKPHVRDRLAGSRGRPSPTCPRCARMRLDHHRAAGRERRGRIAAGDRKRQRESCWRRTPRPGRARSSACAGRSAAAGLRSGSGESSVASSHWPRAHDLREQLELAGRCGRARLRDAPCGRPDSCWRARSARRPAPAIAVGDTLEESARTENGRRRYGSNAFWANSHGRPTFATVPLPKTGAPIS